MEGYSRAPCPLVAPTGKSATGLGVAGAEWSQRHRQLNSPAPKPDQPSSLPVQPRTWSGAGHVSVPPGPLGRSQVLLSLRIAGLGVGAWAQSLLFCLARGLLGLLPRAPGNLLDIHQPTAGLQEGGRRTSAPCECTAVTARRVGLPAAMCLVSGHPPTRAGRLALRLQLPGTGHLCQNRLPAIPGRPLPSLLVSPPVNTPVNQGGQQRPPPAAPGRSRPGVGWGRWGSSHFAGTRGPPPVHPVWTRPCTPAWAWAWATRMQAMWGWARADCWHPKLESPGLRGGAQRPMSFNPLGDVSQHPAWVGFRFHACGHEAGRSPLRGPVRGWGHGS